MSRFAGARAVTFDCWGTLIYEADPAVAVRRRVEDLARLADLDADSASALLSEAWQEHFEAWRRHENFGSPGMVSWIGERVALSEDARAALLRSLEEASLANGVVPVADAVSTLRALRDAGIATALVCDTGFTPGRVVRRLLDEHGIAPLLDGFVFSDEVGVPKPDGRMFAAALDVVGAPPARVVHVGDLRRTDIAGARAAGLGAVRFRGVTDDVSDHPDGDEVIDSLPALLGLLGLPEVPGVPGVPGVPA